MSLQRLLAILVIAFGMTLAAHADPITFTMSYTGSGIFDGSTFTNALVTITSTSDSAFIQSNQRLYLVDGTSVTVAGLGTDSLSGIFENQIYTTSIGKQQNVWVVTFGKFPTTTLPFIELPSATWSSYDYGSTIQITGTPSLVENNFSYATGSGSTFETTALTKNDTATVTYIYNGVGLPGSATPEPASISLLLTGVAGIAYVRRRLRT